MAPAAATFRHLIPAMWLAWRIYWLAAARDVKPAHWGESTASRALHTVPLLLCTVLLVGGHWLPPILTARLAAPGRLLPLLGALAVAIGLAFAVWARRHLGRNWSGIVTVKEGHVLIRSGPYRILRHPIYSGLLLALIGTAAAIDEIRGGLAVVCAVVGFVRKIRVEEQQMLETFVEYDAYRRETAALIPFLY